MAATRNRAGSHSIDDEPDMHLEVEERTAHTVASYTGAFPDVEPGRLVAHLELIHTGKAVVDGLVAHLAREGFEITRPRFTILRLLYLCPERKLLQNEIAREMGVTAANVTQIIDALQGEGWVERVVSPTDRRFTYAQLTPWGVEQCAKLVPAIVDFMDTTCDAISEEEVELLTSILARVRRDLQNRYGLEL